MGRWARLAPCGSDRHGRVLAEHGPGGPAGARARPGAGLPGAEDRQADDAVEGRSADHGRELRQDRRGPAQHRPVLAARQRLAQTGLHPQRMEEGRDPGRPVPGRPGEVEARLHVRRRGRPPGAGLSDGRLDDAAEPVPDGAEAGRRSGAPALGRRFLDAERRGESRAPGSWTRGGGAVAGARSVSGH